MKELIIEILAYIEDIKKVLKSIHFDLIIEITVNILVLCLLVKLIDVFEHKLKTKVLKNKNEQIIKFIPALSRILKFIVFFKIRKGLLDEIKRK